MDTERDFQSQRRLAFLAARDAGREAVRQGFRPASMEDASRYFHGCELGYDSFWWWPILRVLAVEDAESAFLRGVAEEMDRVQEGE